MGLLQSVGEYFLGGYLNKPTARSLEFRAQEGERKVETQADKKYYVYELLMGSGKRYEKSWGGGGIEYRTPSLPRKSLNSSLTVRSRLRKMILPLHYKELEERRTQNEGVINSTLEQVLRDSGIRECVRGISIIGFDEKYMGTELYVLACSGEEADTKIKRYGEQVTKMLQPYYLHCAFKIRPKIENN